MKPNARGFIYIFKCGRCESQMANKKAILAKCKYKFCKSTRVYLIGYYVPAPAGRPEHEGYYHFDAVEEILKRKEAEGVTSEK